MRIPFNLYDFLGYTVPGLIVIIILAILINPALLSNLSNELKDKDSELAQFLRPTVTQGILYVVVCYLVGFATDGLIYWLFRQLANIESLKKFHSRDGWFERALLDCKYRDNSEEFSPYTDEFVENFKVKIEEVFGIKVETVRDEAEQAKNDVKYIEIFDLCRTTVLKQSPDVYSRGFTLLAQYNSAKLIGSIFFLAAVGFLVRIFVPPQYWQWTFILISVWLVVLLLILMSKIVSWRKKKTKETDNSEQNEGNWKLWISKPFLWYWLIAGVFGFIAWWKEGVDILFICYCVSAVLCSIFFHLYYMRLKYYRNTILYGFYEYAVTREKSEESENSEK